MLVRCHLPPRAVGISRSFNPRAMALRETKPAVRRSRIVGANARARASAACLFANPLLILPLLILPFSDVSRSTRVSILTTVVWCHLPPWAVGTPLRFNSFASARRETKPVALSSRMIETKAWARESAARLSANAPCTLRLRDEVPPLTCSIGPSWPDFEVRLGAKNVSRTESIPGLSEAVAPYIVVLRYCFLLLECAIIVTP
jgi:hypothetical protein